MSLLNKTPIEDIRQRTFDETKDAWRVTFVAGSGIDVNNWPTDYPDAGTHTRLDKLTFDGDDLQTREQNLDANGRIRNSAHLLGSDDGGTTLRTLKTKADGTLIIEVLQPPYSLTASDVGASSIPGITETLARGDHAHKGVSSLKSNGNPLLFGDVVLKTGAGIALSQAGNEITIARSAALAKCQFFAATNYDANLGNYRVQTVGASSSQRFTFKIPQQAVTVISIQLVGIIAAGAAGSGKNIDLYSDYATIGETYNTHTQSSTTATYDFTGMTNKITAIDVTSLFTAIAPDDVCGILVDHIAIGGNIYYLGIVLHYSE